MLALADQTSSVLNFNGDDAVVLRGSGGSVVDSVGQVGLDPGVEWGTGLITTLNHTLRRLVSITAADTNTGDVVDPAVEWAGFAVDTFGGLGSHSIPEPTSALLLASGLAGLAAAQRWRRN